MIPLEKMTFDPGDRPDPEADVPKGKLEKNEVNEARPALHKNYSLA